VIASDISQTIFGGKDSNHTKERVIKQSILIETFQHIRSNFQTMFGISISPSDHAAPNMTKTFDYLLAWMIKHQTHEHIPGRKGSTLPDVIEAGLSKCGSGLEVNSDYAEDMDTNKPDREDTGAENADEEEVRR
jgi:hypothetical protein